MNVVSRAMSGAFRAASGKLLLLSDDRVDPASKGEDGRTPLSLTLCHERRPRLGENAFILERNRKEDSAEVTLAEV
jgi:hypothetical protein